MARPRLVLVHGSVGNAAIAWSEQEPLRERFELVLVTRPGYPPGPFAEPLDFDPQADDLAESLADGDHLVGFSYGGVVSLLAAARTRAALASLVVIEPPAFGVAADDPDVAELVARIAAARAEASSPRDYLERFLPLAGSNLELPLELPPVLEQGARAAMAERPPGEAQVPLETLAAAPYPKLVVSGAHSPAFEKVCDTLAEAIGAQRATLPGAGHSVPRLGAPFNALLVEFVEHVNRRPD
jgi:pimeloyl-ACP methyl ester carboxylesterase